MKNFLRHAVAAQLAGGGEGEAAVVLPTPSAPPTLVGVANGSGTSWTGGTPIGLQVGAATSGDKIVYGITFWTTQANGPGVLTAENLDGEILEFITVLSPNYADYFSFGILSVTYDGATAPTIEFGPTVSGYAYNGIVFEDAGTPLSLEGIGYVNDSSVHARPQDPLPLGPGAAYWQSGAFTVVRSTALPAAAVVPGGDDNFFTALFLGLGGAVETFADNNSFGSGGQAISHRTTTGGDDLTLALMGHPTKALTASVGFFGSDSATRPCAAVNIQVPGL